MSVSEPSERRRAEWRWSLVGAGVVAVLVAAQLTAGLVRSAATDEASARERVETCFVERAIPFRSVVDDPIAGSAGRGALRATLEGNQVTLALGSSEEDAARVYDAYLGVAPTGTAQRLELSRKVVFLWDRPPDQPQRDLAHLCARDAQE